MKSNIGTIYRNHKDNIKIHQGDIFRDINVIVDYSYGNHEEINEFTMEYMVVLSQDCDLDRDFISYNDYFDMKNNGNIDFNDLTKCSKEDKSKIGSICDKLLPSVLFCPAFPAEKLRAGTHLENFNNYIMQNKNSKKWNDIKNNEVSRYHFLKGDLNSQIPDLVLDFKRYYTLSPSYVYSIFENSYLGSLNELFREDLSKRFCFYLSRVGLPEI